MTVSVVIMHILQAFGVFPFRIKNKGVSLKKNILLYLWSFCIFVLLLINSGFAFAYGVQISENSKTSVFVYCLWKFIIIVRSGILHLLLFLKHQSFKQILCFMGSLEQNYEDRHYIGLKDFVYLILSFIIFGIGIYSYSSHVFYLDKNIISDKVAGIATFGICKFFSQFLVIFCLTLFSFFIKTITNAVSKQWQSIYISITDSEDHNDENKVEKSLSHPISELEFNGKNMEMVGNPLQLTDSLTRANKFFLNIETNMELLKWEIGCPMSFVVLSSFVLCILELYFIVAFSIGEINNLWMLISMMFNLLQFIYINEIVEEFYQLVSRRIIFS